jgi:hypothetical protein
MSMYRFVTFALFTLGLGCSNSARSRGQDAIQPKFDSLVQLLNAGEVGQIDLLEIEPDIETIVGLTPAQVISGWDYRVSIREPSSSQSAEVAAFLGGALIEAQDSVGGDMRNGIVFYSKKSQKPLLGLFSDRRGRHGAVDDARFLFKKDLCRRLKSILCAPCR